MTVNKAPPKTNRKQPALNFEQKIDDINIKLQGLDQHLVQYNSGMEKILNEIPKDVKSLKSSSRYNFQLETERNSNFVRKSNLNTNNIFNESSHLQRDDSEQTLKTIMDFKSERAQTGQRLHREKIISAGQFPQQMRVSFQETTEIENQIINILDNSESVAFSGKGNNMAILNNSDLDYIVQNE